MRDTEKLIVPFDSAKQLYTVYEYHHFFINSICHVVQVNNYMVYHLYSYYHITHRVEQKIEHYMHCI